MANPRHYEGDGAIDCQAAMRSMMFSVSTKFSPMVVWWWGCAFKYLWRWHWKNGVEDLRKCADCIERLIEEAEKQV